MKYRIAAVGVNTAETGCLQLAGRPSLFLVTKDWSNRFPFGSRSDSRTELNHGAFSFKNGD